MSKPPPTLRDINGQTVYHGDRVYNLNAGKPGVMIFDLSTDIWWFWSDIECTMHERIQQRTGVPEYVAPDPRYGIIKAGGKVTCFRLH